MNGIRDISFQMNGIKDISVQMNRISIYNFR